VFLIFWMTLAGFLLAAIYVSPIIARIAAEKRLRSVCRREHALVLTYDDGPSVVTTPQVLDLLAEMDAKGTFFLLGQRVQSAPHVLKRLQDEGHELASHSQDHLNAWKVAPWRSFVDVKRGFATLAKHGVDFGLFRPPYGKLNLLTWFAAVRYGVRFGWWTVVSGDTFNPLPDPDSIVKAVERDGGGVVLMHDFDSDEVHSKYVLEVTRRLLEKARVHGWKVCTLSQARQ
jgi:peptidoglycan-N-acetylglucosamine deacetylase